MKLILIAVAFLLLFSVTLVASANLSGGLLGECHHYMAFHEGDIEPYYEQFIRNGVIVDWCDGSK